MAQAPPVPPAADKKAEQGGPSRRMLRSRCLVDTLVKRRDALGRAYFELVSPLDEFRLTAEQLCMTDLSVHYGLVPAGVVEWLKGSKVVSSRPVDARGRVCVKAPKNDDYTVFRMRVRRGDEARPPLELHFKAGPTPKVLGLVRVAR